MFRYQGSKRLSAKDISSIIKQKMDETGIKNYVEPFCGSCAVALKMKDYPGIKIQVNDASKYLHVFLKDIQDKKLLLPPKINKEEYTELKKNGETNSTKTFYGLIYGFSGIYFGSYDKTRVDSGSYYENYYNKLFKEDISMFNITNHDYLDLELKEPSIIYCDPPYNKTNSESYDSNIEYNIIDLIDKIEEWKAQGHHVFISEQKMPKDKYIYVYEKCLKQKMGNLMCKKDLGINQGRVEKLFYRV